MLRRAESPSRPPRRRERPRPGPWLLLFAVAVALRMLVVLLTSSVEPAALAPEGDADRIAVSLARGAGFTLDSGSGPQPTAAAPPIVPWLTGLVYRSFGHHPVPLLLLQCVLAGFVPILVGVLGASMFGASIGRVAGWLAAASPLLVLAAPRAGAGVALAVALLAGLAAVASWVKTPRPGRAFGVGLLLGLAALTQVATAPITLIVLAWAWTPLTLTIAPGDRNRQMALVLLGLAMVVGPWVLRNWVTMRAPVLATSIGRRLLEGNNAAAWDRRDARAVGVDAAVALPGRAEARGPGEPGRDVEDARAAGRFLRARAAQWPGVAFAKTVRFWTAARLDRRAPAARPTGEEALAWVVRVWSVVVLPFALYGFAGTLAGARRWFQSLPAWIVFLFGLASAVFYASLALRLAVEPLVLLFAAAGFEDLRRRVRARGRGLKVIEGHR